MINGYVAVHFMKENKQVYHEYYTDLYAENVELHQQLEEFYSYGIKVDVTMYQPVWPQTNRTPHITADGTEFDIEKASRYRYVALSRNLLRRWGGPFDYGDFVFKCKIPTFKWQCLCYCNYSNFICFSSGLIGCC